MNSNNQSNCKQMPGYQQPIQQNVLVKVEENHQNSNQQKDMIIQKLEQRLEKVEQKQNVDSGRIDNCEKNVDKLISFSKNQQQINREIIAEQKLINAKNEKLQLDQRKITMNLHEQLKQVQERIAQKKQYIQQQIQQQQNMKLKFREESCIKVEVLFQEQMEEKEMERYIEQFLKKLRYSQICQKQFEQMKKNNQDKNVNYQSFAVTDIKRAYNFYRTQNMTVKQDISYCFPYENNQKIAEKDRNRLQLFWKKWLKNVDRRGKNVFSVLLNQIYAYVRTFERQNNKELLQAYLIDGNQMIFKSQ